MFTVENKQVVTVTVPVWLAELIAVAARNGVVHATKSVIKGAGVDLRTAKFFVDNIRNWDGQDPLSTHGGTVREVGGSVVVTLPM